VANVILTAVKLVAALLTGAVSMLSEAVHSATDIFASLMAYLGIRAASVPPDEDHPYGHGKIESLAGFGESIMVFGMVAYVAFESVMRLIKPEPIKEVSIGVIVMAVSIVVAFLASARAAKVGRETNSMALKSNAAHWMLDAVTSVAVLIGLLVYLVTKATWVDPVLGLGLSIWMFWGAVRLSREAFHELIDVVLPEAEIRQIIGLIENDPDVLGYHRLRTRRSGELRHIDLHIVVPAEWSVVKAHDVADALENRIEEALRPAKAVIHVDPFDENKALRG
jgi:cation diffusion facilitator family transporter